MSSEPERWGRLSDSRRCEIDLPPSRVFAPIRRIGGEVGWYGFDWLWRLRGFLDLLVGGVGMRRGRPDPEQLRVGDTLDWWRVEAYRPDRLLRLRAELRLPGHAWLEFRVEPGARGSIVWQTASFAPRGWLGRLYWYAILPLHALVFRGMLSGIARAGARAVRHVRRVLVACLAWWICSPASASTPGLLRADAVWEQRAEGQREGRARPERARAAVAAYERALATDPDQLEAHWKLLRALWFAADLASDDAAAARALYEQALAASESAIATLGLRVGGAEVARSCENPEALRARIPEAERSDAAALYFWYAIDLGAWTRNAGLVQAVRRGIANRLHQATLCSLALDPDVEQGGAIRLLSRLHSELPRVPLLSGWVDPRRAVPLAERALAEYPGHPGNSYLLGLALLSHAPERRAEGLRLIQGTAALEPRSDHVVEDLAIRRDARERLAREDWSQRNIPGKSRHDTLAGAGRTRGAEPN